nr:helix-turn-helix transcriptional regulator [uncultured Campylobacter sp.]
MTLAQMLEGIHKQIEDLEMKDISQKEMAQRLGISLSAYASWLGDTKKPKAMSALLDMLAMLDDEGMVMVVREWESSKKEKSKEDKKWQ